MPGKFTQNFKKIGSFESTFRVKKGAFTFRKNKNVKIFQNRKKILVKFIFL